jgi:hypothetical protein
VFGLWTRLYTGLPSRPTGLDALVVAGGVLTDEADLSTEEAQTCARSWLPDAHENPRRSGRTQAPSPQESLASHTLST